MKDEERLEHEAHGGAVAEEREGWRDTALVWRYRALERAAMAVPEAIGRPLAIALGSLGYRCLGALRATVAANQARVLGLDLGDERVRRSTREAFELYARYWYDTFRLRAMSAAAIVAATEIVGLEHLDRALAAGKGCVAALPHMGNWDAAGRFLALRGYRMASVAEELRPRRLWELFLHHRRELGLEILPLDEAAHVAERLARLLGENCTVALVADRDLTGHGVDVEMYGAKRRVPAGPAFLSLETGAPLIVAAVYTTRAGWRIEIGPPLELEATGDRHADVAELARRMAARLERLISARPADWHVFQPAWEDDAVPQPGAA